MDDRSAQYQPGVCNIGAADVRARAVVGWIGAAATVMVAAVLLAIGAHPALMLVAAIPAYVAATGFLQARSRFCVGYAAAGRFGLDADRRGPTGRVDDDQARAADRARARELNGRAARWTIGAAIVLVTVAWVVG